MDKSKKTKQAHINTQSKRESLTFIINNSLLSKRGSSKEEDERLKREKAQFWMWIVEGIEEELAPNHPRLISEGDTTNLSFEDRLVSVSLEEDHVRIDIRKQEKNKCDSPEDMYGLFETYLTIRRALPEEGQVDFQRRFCSATLGVNYIRALEAHIYDEETLLASEDGKPLQYSLDRVEIGTIFTELETLAKEVLDKNNCVNESAKALRTLIIGVRLLNEYASPKYLSRKELRKINKEAREIKILWYHKRAEGDFVPESERNDAKTTKRLSPSIEIPWDSLNYLEQSFRLMMDLEGESAKAYSMMAECGRKGDYEGAARSRDAARWFEAKANDSQKKILKALEERAGHNNPEAA